MINDYKNYTEVAAASCERLEEVRFILNDWTYDAYIEGNEDGTDMRTILNILESIAIIVVNDCVTAMYESLPGPQARMRELSGYLDDIKDNIKNTYQTIEYIDTLREMKNDKSMRIHITTDKHELDNIWPYKDNIASIIDAIIPSEVVSNALACQMEELSNCFDEAIALLREDGKIEE